jgi:hypothetical protein
MDRGVCLQDESPIRAEVISQLSVCPDEVFGSQYLARAKTPDSTVKYPEYGACPLQGVAWYSRDGTVDVGNWQAYDRVMSFYLRCHYHTAPFILTDPGRNHHHHGLVLDRSSSTEESTETEVAPLKPESPFAPLWGIPVWWTQSVRPKPSYDYGYLFDAKQDNILLTALDACKAVSCVPVEGGMPRSSFSTYTACVQANVWDPFIRACVGPGHTCQKRLHPSASSNCPAWPAYTATLPSSQGEEESADPPVESRLHLEWVVAGVGLVAVVWYFLKANKPFFASAANPSSTKAV